MLWCVVGWAVLPLFYGWVLDAVVRGGLGGLAAVLWVSAVVLDGLAAVLWVGVRCCGVWWIGRSCRCFMGGC